LNDEIVGFGCLVVKNSFWQESFVGYISTLVVDEEQRNKGIGKGLIVKLTELAKQEGCKRIELDSGFHREQAHLFYEHLNFNKRAFLFSKVIE
jgi:GNAT superfamily N-acetyltransferase